MSDESGPTGAGNPSESNVRGRLSTIARYGIALWWGLAGLVAVLRADGPTSAGVAAILIAVAFIRWPSVLRWLMLGLAVLAPAVFVAAAHWYFRALTNYPLIIWALLGIVVHLLLLFGKMTTTRFALGVAVFVTYFAVSPAVLAGSPLSSDACDARVGAFSRRVQAFLATPSGALQLHSAKLPILHNRPRATEAYPVLEVGPAGRWLDRRLSDDASEAARELRAALELLATRGTSEPVGLYLAADASASVSEIAVLLAPVTHVRVFLLGRAEDGPTDSPPESARALAAALDQARNMSELAGLASNELSRRAGSCRPLAKRLVHLNDLPPASRPPSLAKALDEGLRECNCGWVDVDAMEYLVMRILGAPAPGHGVIPLLQDESGHPIVPTQSDLTVQQWAQGL